jgi:hypothetical protein
MDGCMEVKAVLRNPENVICLKWKDTREIKQTVRKLNVCPKTVQFGILTNLYHLNTGHLEEAEGNFLVVKVGQFGGRLS